MGVRRARLAFLCVIVLLGVASCSLFNRAATFAWETIEDVKVMAVDFVDDLPVQSFDDVRDLAARVIRPVQRAAGSFYMSIRGVDLQEIVGDAQDYAIIIWEDINGNDQIDEGEPFQGDTRGNQGFRLGSNTSFVGSISIAPSTSTLSYTAYTIDASYTLSGNTASGFELDLTATVPGATEVTFWHSQGGWFPNGGVSMSRSGDVFTATVTGLEAGPLAFKYQINGEVVWYPDHNEPGYFPNIWTFWDDLQIDWNSAIMITDSTQTDAFLSINVVDLQGDPISNNFNFVVDYTPVEPFWEFGENPFAVDIHETLPSSPGDALAGDGTVSLDLRAGAYYLITIAEDAVTPTYLDHRVYLYAHEDYAGQTLTAHLSTSADVTGLYTDRGLTEPAYDTTDVTRGFAFVTFTDLANALPWDGTRDFAYHGLEISYLPTGSFGGDPDTPFVYEVFMADETASTTPDDFGIIAGSVLDYTGNTTLAFPENREYYGYSVWEGETSYDRDLAGATVPDLGFLLGATSGAFFIDYFGIGHLVRIPTFKTTGTGVHETFATLEVMLP